MIQNEGTKLKTKKYKKILVCMKQNGDSIGTSVRKPCTNPDYLC